MTNQTPNFYALLIGINFYFPHRLPEGNYYKNLRGCVQDINHVETYLKDTFNLTPDQIIKLTATASDNPNQPQEPPELLPTYENIVAKFKELTAKAKPQDRVYIHYSGHGGRAKTIYENIKGFGTLDEALVPTDIGQPNSCYLRDLELAKLLEEMVEKELVVTLVLDSCHSGGATKDIETDEGNVRRGGFIDMMERPTDSLVAPLQELAQNWQISTEYSRNITVVNGLLPEPKGYTLIAACREDEFAYEKVFEGTERNGALTYYLLKALRKYGIDIPVKYLYDHISNLVRNDFKRQTPLLIGETDRTFLGGQSVVTSLNAPVMKVDIPKNRVQIQMGEANGLKKGAEFDIFRFWTRSFENSDNRIATVKVVEVGASDCWAELTELHNEFRTRELHPKLTEGIIEIGSPAVYVGPPLEQIRKVRILLPDPLPQIPGVDVSSLPGILETQKEEVENHSWIEFCPETEKDENVNYFVSVNSQGEYLILDAQKEPIKNVLLPLKVDAPEAAKKLINRLIHITLYQNRLEWDNEDTFSTLNGKLKVELVKSVKRGQIVVLNADGKVPVLEKGAGRVDLLIHNESTQTLNITALIFDMNFRILQIYPERENYEVVKPKDNRRVKLTLSLPENYEEGVNVVKVFATLDATNYRLWELPALDQDLQGRMAEVVTDASEEWTTEKVEVVLR
jgi:hypothetical protein